MKVKFWDTKASRNGNVEGIVANDNPVLGGLCVIQVKRYGGAGDLKIWQGVGLGQAVA
jgi:restriction system protein